MTGGSLGIGVGRAAHPALVVSGRLPARDAVSRSRAAGSGRSAEANRCLPRKWPGQPEPSRRRRRTSQEHRLTRNGGSGSRRAARSPAAARLDRAAGPRRDEGEASVPPVTAQAERSRPKPSRPAAPARSGRRSRASAVGQHRLEQREQAGIEARLRLALRPAPHRPGRGAGQRQPGAAGRRAAGARTPACGSAVKWPSCSASRARQVTCRRLPGWSSGRARRPSPPFTRPAWRPWPKVSATRIASVSPCGRTLSTSASSCHSIAAQAPGTDQARAAPVTPGRWRPAGGGRKPALACGVSPGSGSATAPLAAKMSRRMDDRGMTIIGTPSLAE